MADASGANSNPNGGSSTAGTPTPSSNPASENVTPTETPAQTPTPPAAANASNTPPATIPQSPVNLSQAPLQFVSSAAHANQAVRASVPHQQLQVIHPGGYPIQQQYAFPQQIMFNTNAMQGQAVPPQVGIIPNRPHMTGAKSPNIMAANSNVQNIAMKTSVQGSVASQLASNQHNMGNSSAMKTGQVLQQPNAAQLLGGKTALQQQGGQPVLISHMGVISSQGMARMPQQKGAIVSVAGGQPQVISSPQSIRFSTQPALVTNTGHIISNPNMLNHLQVANLQQLSNLPQQLIGAQPFYIRAGIPIGPQSFIQTVGLKQGEPVKPGTQIKQNAASQVQPKTFVKPRMKINQKLNQETTEKMIQVQPSNLQLAQQQQKQVNRVKGQTKITPTSNIAVPKTAVQTTQTPTATVQPKVQTPIKIAAKQTTSNAAQTSKTIEKHRNLFAAVSRPPLIAQPPCQPTLPVTTVNGELVPNNQTLANTAQELNFNETSLKKENEAMEVTETAANVDPAVVTLPTIGGGEKKAAIVKPNVLTHIIEGFVIQEGNEPFPVQRSSLLTDSASGAKEDSIERDSSEDRQKAQKEKKKLNSEKRKEKQKILQDGKDSKPRSYKDFLGLTDTRPDNIISAKQALQLDRILRKKKGCPPLLDMPKVKCEFCGIVDYANKFRRSKRFCSMVCAKRYNVGCSRRLGLFRSENVSYIMRKKKLLQQAGKKVRNGKNGKQDSTDGPNSQASDGSTNAEGQSPPRSQNFGPVTAFLERTHSITSTGTSISTATDSGNTGTSSEEDKSTVESSGEGSLPMREDSPQPMSTPPRSPPVLEREVDMDLGRIPACEPENRHPNTWSVQDVYDFICALPGCAPYADGFKNQEIDGQALLLLKEDHLMSAMNMKLGPALKISARITSLKEEHDSLNK